jgi:type IV secretory pathway ATPase VirB11/archaellum biosynthesis ATPase
MTGVVLRPQKKSVSKPVVIPSSTRRDESATGESPPRGFDPSKAEKGLLRMLARGRRMRPSFSSSWVIPEPPDGDLLHEYRAGGATVRLIKAAATGEVVYHVSPDEFALPFYQNRVIHDARKELSGAAPDAFRGGGGAFPREAAMDKSIGIVSRLLEEVGAPGLAPSESADLAATLSETLARYSVGLGVLEVPLADPYVQDIYVDAPADSVPVHVALGPTPVEIGSGKCSTNIILTEDEAKSILSRMRLASGRPLSEAMPVLETDLEEFKTRVTVVGAPLSPEGLAIALRRHSNEPWTLPRLVAAKSLTPQAAGLLWLLIDGRATILVAGSRGAGKSSLLSALMLEFPLSQRILTIEDTLELPGPQMQAIGYKVQSLFVRSTLGGTEELTADDALRVSLRLGESAIVLGEVRGREAKTLYEAMRSGSAGSAVLGTIHGNSPLSVYERIVFDLGIPAKSFNATDVVVVCGLVRPGGSQRQLRRVTSISEVVKSPDSDAKFVDLMRYDERKDALVETEHLRRGSDKLRSIASSWGMRVEELLDNVEARAKTKHSLVAASRASPEFSGARWNALSNSQFLAIVDRMGTERNYGMAYDKWRAWLEGATGLRL